VSVADYGLMLLHVAGLGLTVCGVVSAMLFSDHTHTHSGVITSFVNT
jgi:hypothetical protein